MSVSNYFLDTNIFLRIVVKDDQRKVAECEKLIQAVSEGKIKAFTSSLVLAEFVWTCQRLYKLNKSEVIQMLRGILSIKNLKIEDWPNPLIAVETYNKYPVKFIDAMIASYPLILNGSVKVISYDKDFDKLGVVRTEPDEVDF